MFRVLIDIPENPSTTRVVLLAERIGKHLADRGLLLATAESCTGGGIARAITAVAGSSGWFDRGFVTYSNRSKEEMLGVSPTTLEIHGAVSEAVAREMALGALARGAAHLGVAVSGIAGPDGGTAAKPVGTVCFAWAMKAGDRENPVCRSTTEHFSGDRAAVRRKAVARALAGMEEILREPRQFRE